MTRGGRERREREGGRVWVVIDCQHTVGEQQSTRVNGRKTCTRRKEWTHTEVDGHKHTSPTHCYLYCSFVQTRLCVFHRWCVVVVLFCIPLWRLTELTTTLSRVTLHRPIRICLTCPVLTRSVRCSLPVPSYACMCMCVYGASGTTVSLDRLAFESDRPKPRITNAARQHKQLQRKAKNKKRGNMAKGSKKGLNMYEHV